jgi:hypothetical protein
MLRYALVYFVALLAQAMVVAWAYSVFEKRREQLLRRQLTFELPCASRWWLGMIVIMGSFAVVGYGIYLILPYFVPEIENPVRWSIPVFLMMYLYFGGGLVLIFPWVMDRLATGRIVIDQTGFRWWTKHQNGEMVWTEPLQMSYGRAWRRVIRRKWPYTVCSIRQGHKQISFHYEANPLRLENLPEVKANGIYLHKHASFVIKQIEELGQSYSHSEVRQPKTISKAAP